MYSTEEKAAYKEMFRFAEILFKSQKVVPDAYYLVDKYQEAYHNSANYGTLMRRAQSIVARLSQHTTSPSPPPPAASQANVPDIDLEYLNKDGSPVGCNIRQFASELNVSKQDLAYRNGSRHMNKEMFLDFVDDMSRMIWNGRNYISKEKMLASLNVDEHRYYVCKRLAEKFRLFKCVDSNYAPAGLAQGKTKAYEFDVNHPLYVGDLSASDIPEPRIRTIGKVQYWYWKDGIQVRKPQGEQPIFIANKIATNIENDMETDFPANKTIFLSKYGLVLSYWWIVKKKKVKESEALISITNLLKKINNKKIHEDIKKSTLSFGPYSSKESSQEIVSLLSLVGVGVQFLDNIPERF